MSQKHWLRLGTKFVGNAGMWEINKVFLTQQIAMNKAFVFLDVFNDARLA